MKCALLFLMLLSASTKTSAQLKNFTRVDQHAATLGYYPVDVLAQKLTEPFYTDSEKVRAIFYWITTHIAYDVDEYHGNRMVSLELSAEDTARAETLFMEKIANEAIQKHKGICAGYAALFKVLCDRAKLTAVIIDGYAKIASSDIGKPFDENHAWNAVKINGNWLLVDACWAAGYCDDAVTKFTRRQAEFFYFTPPWLFIYNHYPTDSKWTLINNPISKELYGNYPHWHRFKKSLIKASFTPVNGVLTAKVGDTLKIAVELYESDSASFQRKLDFNETDAHDNPIYHEQPIKPQQQTLNNIKKKITYDYVVWSDRVKEIYMVYGEEYLIAYRLQAHL